MTDAPKPLTEITIAGRTYKVGRLTEEQVHETRPDRKRMEEVRAAGGDMLNECSGEMARVSIVLLRQHAPDVTVELFEEMTWPQILALSNEFMRQLDELVKFHERRLLDRGTAGNA